MGILFGALALAAGMAPARLPSGIAPPPVPADNPTSAAKVELGRRLFYDADLSIDGTMSCATCHEQHRGFGDGNRTHPGVHGDPGRRNVPGLTNIAWMPALTSADPRIITLEAQVLVPVLGEHPVEMGMKGRAPEIVTRLGKDGCYVRMFATAFPGDRIDMDNIARAIASFERTLISYDSPYDAYRRGKSAALTGSARYGLYLFEGPAGCSGCHSGPNFSDGAYHAILPVAERDRGLGEVTGQPSDDGRFRTPGLRNITLTGPYFHDGSAPTLPDAIRRHRPGYRLSDRDMNDLIALLGSLTDRQFIADKRLALPDKACGRRL